MDCLQDINLLKGLAECVAEISKKPVQDERRELWRKSNSMVKTRPLIFLHVGGWDAMGSEVINGMLACHDPFFREIEFKLRYAILKDEIGDDEIIEPWLQVEPVFSTRGWGIDQHHVMPGSKGGAYKILPGIRENDDIRRMKVPKHEIDKQKSMERYEKATEAIGDIIQVDCGRGTAYMSWGADISTDLAQLVGLEELMYDCHDRPEWLHEILAFMRDGVLKAQQEAEDSDDWRLTCHHNQAMPYCRELAAPKANSIPVKRNELWGFFAAQEFALISPEMHEEFLLNYQIPIMEKFGLVAYGCCEDLTRKIKMLRKVRNLRRIAVTPWADMGKCADQIQKDYVMSWRPNPASTICSDWNPDFIRKTVREAMEAARGCIVDITLKDVQTLQGEAWRFGEWVKIVREASAGY